MTCMSASTKASKFGLQVSFQSRWSSLYELDSRSFRAFLTNILIFMMVFVCQTLEKEKKKKQKKTNPAAFLLFSGNPDEKHLFFFTWPYSTHFSCVLTPLP